MTSSLHLYRKRASFCPKQLRIALEGEETVQLKQEFYGLLERNSVFRRPFTRPSMQDARKMNHLRWKELIKMNLVADPYTDYNRYKALSDVLETYDQGLSARMSLHSSVFGSALSSMGTERHRAIINQMNNNEIVGCFCLTELSHGSNTQEMQTTATFDKGEFVINTPNQGAIKCWAGNLAQSATHAIVFAQLHVSGKNEGLHAFVLQVRDMSTWNVLPGITIGDMGEKPGDWNGVENGWMEFKNHRAPLWTLLNKGCDVTSEGNYVNQYKSTRERQSVSLGALSVGRIGIIGKGIVACGLASVISIRYSAARKQFGPQKGVDNEVCIWEYPLQNHRLLPYLSAHITMKMFHNVLLEYFTEYMMRVMQGEKTEELAEFSKEVHALSSSAKPVATWLGVEALGEARRACGGHGYLYSSRLNDLRDSFDPSQTFEGENNILIQQTSNILLAKHKAGKSALDTPMGTFSFLRNPPQTFSGRFHEDVTTDVILAFEWLVQYLIKDTGSEFAKWKAQGSFAARNHSQVYRAHPLSIAYAELTMIKWGLSYVAKEVTKPELVNVLRKNVTLFGLFCLEKHLATLYIGGYCNGPLFGEGIRKARLDLQTVLADEAMTTVDAVAPPDFVLHSTLGMSDGDVYGHLMREFRELGDSKPAWWKDLSDFIHSQAPKNKL